jgi:NAD(P)H-nitrite reductase large subunit
MNEQEIIDGLKTICYCKGIPKKVFLKQIASGVKTVEGLKEATGAGSGSCQGRRCTPRIEDLLEERGSDESP